LRNPNLEGDRESVFYFPGCGSERLFSQVGMATLAMLYQTGVNTVLPPGYLCCGYPQISAGDEAKGQAITTENRVLFHRVANTLNYLDIDTVVVSCGTCLDQLLKYEFERIFPGSRLLDIHEFLHEKGMTLAAGKKYLYHDPCHSPIKNADPVSIAADLLQSEVVLSKRCCSEAGTLATARPDIAQQLRHRKLEELNAGLQQLQAPASEVKCLTSCPACQQGLSRYSEDTGIETDYIVVEMAEQQMGKDWMNQFAAEATNGGIEKVLL